MTDTKPKTETPDPTTGRIVLYTLTDDDAARIETERPAIGARGDEVAEGDIVPLIVVRAVIDDDRRISGQAILAGNDNLWVVGAPEGDADEPGTWRYPTRD